MSERKDQFTVEEGNGQGEQQDNVSDRDEKAATLADAVTNRESLEKRTMYILCGLALFIMVASFTALAFGLKRVNTISEQNRVVVCNLHSGYEEQLKSSQKFLKANPNGGDLLGVKFTRGDLLRSIAVAKKRLADTAAAKC